MTTLKITVKNKDDIQWLIELLDSLNIEVSVDDTGLSPVTDVHKGTFTSEEEFLSLCGLWKGRDISAKKLREKAWRPVDL